MARLGIRQSPDLTAGSGACERNKAERLRASLVYPCVGGQPSAPLNANHRNLRGAINVDDELRVEGFDNVYGAGDCASTKEEKNAFSADLNATAVVQNIRARQARRPARGYPKCVCDSDLVPRIAVVSLHKWNAVMQFNGLVLGGAFPAFVKWFIEATNQPRLRSSRGDCAVGRSGGSERVLGSESTVLIVRAHDAK